MATRTEQVQYTPGPWAVGPYGSDLEIQGGGIQLARVRTTRAGVDELAEPRAVPIPEAGANARLIAAAPDLLAAAQTILADLHARIDRAMEEGGRAVPVFNGTAELAAAIAKATGTTHQEEG